MPTGGGGRGHCWIPAHDGQIPPRAFPGGMENGQPIYIARAPFQGGLIPGKFVDNYKTCYLPWGGEEHTAPHYEILCNFRGNWVASSGGNIPANAVPGGRSEGGETLYVGRALYNGALTVGKVHPSHGGLYIPWGGKEVSFQEYEILVSEELEESSLVESSPVSALESKIEEEMKKEATLAALATGLEAEAVKRVIRSKLEETNQGFSSANDLVLAVLETTSSEESSKTTPETASNDVNPDDDTRTLCKICWVSEVGIVFQPCGHLMSCVDCSNNLEECPLCRGVINGRVRTYLS